MATLSKAQKNLLDQIKAGNIKLLVTDEDGGQLTKDDKGRVFISGHHKEVNTKTGKNVNGNTLYALIQKKLIDYSWIEFTTELIPTGKAVAKIVIKGE